MRTLAVVALLAYASAARAQEDPISALAGSLAEGMTPHWTGPRVPWPDPAPRPESAGMLESALAPVAVHVDAEIDPDRAQAALAALEATHDWLERHRWPLPISDGGYGGTSTFDLYLRSDPAEEPIAVAIDAPRSWEGLDGASTFAVVHDPGERLEPCIASAYVQAILLGEDPAEAPAWRIAIGDLVAWLTTGELGCSDAGAIAAQRDATLGWIDDTPASGHRGAILLGMLSARADEGTGDFIRDLWSGGRQLTWDGDELRASPDMWQVVDVVMTAGHDPLERLIETFGVERFFAGPSSSYPILRGLPSPPLTGRTTWERLPRRFEPGELELQAYGSAYYEIDVTRAPPHSTLEVWMRGEYGVAWSLTAVRLDADGHDLGRTRAPARARNPQSYIPLELTDAHTARVLLVVTNLGARVPDADEPDDQSRAFRLILDRGQ